jgi:hypothetical protein
MTDSFEALRNLVMAEVARQRPARGSKRHERMLGRFLETCLRHKGHTLDEFARLLEVKPQVARLLLKGDLPEWMLSDDLLLRLGRIVEYEPNLLRIMLGRKIIPTSDDSDAEGALQS